jgi:hypothetical protein
VEKRIGITRSGHRSKTTRKSKDKGKGKSTPKPARSRRRKIELAVAAALIAVAAGLAVLFTLDAIRRNEEGPAEQWDPNTPIDPDLRDGGDPAAPP